MNERQLFQQYIAPTSPDPMALPIVKAKGATLWDDEGKAYIDLGAGISVCNVGHCHPKVVEALHRQIDQYLHVMVYGEVIQTPQVAFAALLAKHLPDGLDSVYFTNSGAESVEGAMKLAKRLTGRTEIIATKNSYHGSTQGALSLLGDEYWRQAFRPLLPDIRHIRHNDFEELQLITNRTACIILEPIQAEAGVLIPEKSWMQALRQRCTETGTLLVLDEIQTGFGRTGTLWAFEQMGMQPDILLLAKALGGGMPLGAFISSRKNMEAFTTHPVLGHITTFGGHPVCCAAGKAAMEVILEEKLLAAVPEKEQLFKQLLHHPSIKEVRGRGLLLAVEFKDFETMHRILKKGLACSPKAVFTDWFLFAPNCLRISPPLTITISEVQEACDIILKCCG